MHKQAMAGSDPPERKPLDLRERGATRAGEPQWSEGRLYVQLVVLECPRSPGTEWTGDRLIGRLAQRGVGCALYADLHHALSLGLLVWTEDPEILSGPVRQCIADPELPQEVRVRPELGMVGRTYSTGYEPDLEDWLLYRPRRTLLDPAHVWAIWYPLRRRGTFAQLSARDQADVMREHGGIGRDYGERDFAHDIRLSCHGLDASDNDFVIGLVGRELYPLSHVVQAMRRTRQTAEFVEKMGPFFVGRLIRSSPEPGWTG
jgi:hypothetical protein